MARLLATEVTEPVRLGELELRACSQARARAAASQVGQSLIDQVATRQRKIGEPVRALLKCPRNRSPGGGKRRN